MTHLEKIEARIEARRVERKFQEAWKTHNPLSSQPRKETT